MSWISRVLESARCGFNTYICAKFDANPIQCVKEARCDPPKTWMDINRDKFELKKDSIQDKESDVKKIKT